MFNTILIPLDGSSLAEQALGRGMAIARATGAELELALVHQPFPFDGFPDAPWVSQLWDAERDYLETVNAEIRIGGLVSTRHAVLRGEPVDMICRHIHDVHADLVVLTTHARTGLNRAWLGSVADGIVRHSTVPVLVLRPVHGASRKDASRHLFRHMLVPVDGSSSSTEILKAATALAKCSDAKLTLLRVVEPTPIVSMDAGLPETYMPGLMNDSITRRLADEATEQLVEMARVLHEDSGLAVDAHVIVEPHVGQAIIDFAERHGNDLVAMATHGRGISRLLLGSVADKVMRGGTLPMLLIRPVHVHQGAHAETVAEMASFSSE
jgi:nucleotide-binding universal stress UspA family protein